MVKTNSNFVELGISLPKAKMINTNSTNNYYYDFSKLDARHLLILFICAHCPFVKHLEKAISDFTEEFENGVQTIAVSSNDILNYPDDAPGKLRLQAKINNWNFPYLYDEDQNFAKDLKAACTPDFYLFSNLGNNNFSLFYHGQFDESRPSNEIPVTGKDLRLAANALVSDCKSPPNQRPSLGCNIKWISGNEPNWFK